MTSRLVAGVGGSKAGWMFVVVDATRNRIEACSVAPTFSELLVQTTGCADVGIDVPIGLPDIAAPGGRAADRNARELLKPGRHTAVLAAPPRAVLQARSFEEANEIHRRTSENASGISRQAYGAVAKIAEVDDLMTPRIQQRVFEVHPELSFMELNHGEPMALGRTRAGGLLARIRILSEHGLIAGLEDVMKDIGKTRLDDAVDATVVAWTAARKYRDEAVRLPERPERDVRGLRMEIWR